MTQVHSFVPTVYAERAFSASDAWNVALLSGASMRRSRRLGERVTTSATVDVLTGTHRATALIVDVSATGCALRLPGLVRSARQSMLVVLLPSASGALEIPARWVRAFAGADAYEFIGLDDADRLSIAEALDWLAPTEKAERMLGS